MAKKKTVTQYYTHKGLTGKKKGAKRVSRRKYYGTDNWGVDRVDWMRHGYDYSNHVSRY